MEISELKGLGDILANNNKDIEFKYSILEEKYGELEAMRGAWAKDMADGEKEVAKLDAAREKLNRDRMDAVELGAKLQNRVIKLEDDILNLKDKHSEILRVRDEERNSLLEKLNQSMFSAVESLGSKLTEEQKSKKDDAQKLSEREKMKDQLRSELMKELKGIKNYTMEE